MQNATYNNESIYQVYGDKVYNEGNIGMLHVMQYPAK